MVVTSLSGYEVPGADDYCETRFLCEARIARYTTGEARVKAANNRVGYIRRLFTTEMDGLLLSYVTLIRDGAVTYENRFQDELR